MSLNNSPTSIQTNNLYNNTNNSNSNSNITNSNDINDMDTFLKNFQLYKLLKDELENPNSMFKDNIELEYFLTFLQANFFLDQKNIFNNTQQLNNLKNLLHNISYPFIDKQAKKILSKRNSYLYQEKLKSGEFSNEELKVDNYFEQIKEQIATGKIQWSELNPKEANEFKQFLLKKYGILFKPTNDNDARYNKLGQLKVTSSKKSGGFYKQSKRKKGSKSKKRRTIKRKQYAG